MTEAFNGLAVGLPDISRMASAKTRSISAENFTGAKGGGGRATEGMGANCARDLGTGWKVSPCMTIETGQTLTLADIEGPGAIQHIWLTPNSHWRHQILRMYWDDETTPSVEVPLGDFFACGWNSMTWNHFTPVVSLPVSVNPRSGLNCYWPMPFRKRARITVENIGHEKVVLYYQIDYALAEVGADQAYFHAQFRRNNPLPYGETHILLDGVKGRGQFVGTYMALGVNNNGWWGEGEIKFYMDGDKEFPTICGTGAEDYFCGSYAFDVNGKYQEYSGPYTGMQVIPTDNMFRCQLRFGLYRWHIADPIRFETDFKAELQALGWRIGGRYLPLQDDIATTAFWYQADPHAPFPQLPDRDRLEII